MGEKQHCYLCGLQADNLPAISGKDVIGISCKRCGDYYWDGLLAACKEPIDEENRIVLSGYTKWEKEIGNPPPVIVTSNIDQIVQDKKCSDEDKVDKLLLYYSKKYPNKGKSANYDSKLDYPITFSKNSDEFIYLLKKVADESLGLIKVQARGIFTILPDGWNRTEWLKKNALADEKYKIDEEKIFLSIDEDRMNLVERAGLNGLRWSSVLARQLKSLYLKGSINKLDKKLEVDRNIIFGNQKITNPEDVNFLSIRLKRLVSSEEKFLIERIRESYIDCKVSKHYCPK